MYAGPRQVSSIIPRSLTYYSSCGKVMFSQACVENSVRGGVCPKECWDTHSALADTPLGRHPLGRHLPADTPGRHPPADTRWAETPLGRHHPLSKHPPSTTGYGQQAVCILLECILILYLQTYSLGDPPPRPHPQTFSFGPCSDPPPPPPNPENRLESGWLAFDWNTFLLYSNLLHRR